ncbi:hypothetical protein ONZ43_g3053 [Nemania bipapillata]|uniref:Uncharacterized protein n=1 Tax=Nemania bipapillata TaxID=110536 RepID=A0ACC2IYF5_9PEZI|nr:hypothetical protein ONZ43_g3053 [Nemania bipapillata]
MLRWENKGPDHNRQERIQLWIDLLDEFKHWLCERLDKTKPNGELYFPVTYERGVRVQRNVVLMHLVKWILINMSMGNFDSFNDRAFREGLDKSFSNLIYEWDVHFSGEPRYHTALREFNSPQPEVA